MLDLTPYLPQLFALALIVAGPMVMLTLSRRQSRGTFGRPYDLIMRDYFREAERRGRLLSLGVVARAQRLDRQERRYKRTR